MQITRGRWVALWMTVVLSVSLVPAQATQTMDRERAPYDSSDTDAYCNGVQCSYNVTADAATGAIRMDQNATATIGNSSGGATWAFLDHTVSLQKPQPALQLEVNIDLEIAQQVGGERGNAATELRYLIHAQHDNRYYGYQERGIADLSKECGWCGDDLPDQVGPERRTITLWVYDWAGSDLPVGDYDIHLMFEGRANAQRAQEREDLVNVAGIKYTIDAESPGEVYAAYQADIHVVSLSLKEVPREVAEKIPPRDLRTNHTFDMGAPFETMYVNPGCYDECTDAVGNNETGEFFARKQFSDAPSTSEIYQRAQTIEFRSGIHFPYGADSAHLTGRIRIDDATTSLSDPSGNGYGYVAVDAVLVKGDCGTSYCLVEHKVVLAATGTCASCSQASVSSLEDGVIDLDLLLVDPNGVTSPGFYNLMLTIRAVAKPSTVELAPGRSVATSGASAEVAGVVERLMLELDPAPWSEPA